MAVDLVVNPELVCVFIVKARQVNVKEVSGFENDGSDGPDDGMHGVLQEDPNDDTRQELGDMIDSLNEEEAAELVAMCWIGRGDYDAREFAQAKNDARERAGSSGTSTSQYLLGIPLLADYLDEGLNALGWSCGEHAVEYLRAPESVELSGRVRDEPDRK